MHTYSILASFLWSWMDVLILQWHVGNCTWCYCDWSGRNYIRRTSGLESWNTCLVFCGVVVIIQGHSGLGYVCCAVMSGMAKTLRVIFLSSFFHFFPLLENHCLKFRGCIPTAHPHPLFYFFYFFLLEMFISVSLLEWINLNFVT